jgi:hypothetical protein
VLAARGADADDSVRVSLRVAGGKLVDGPKVIRLKRNAAVVLTVLSDTADEVHVHGYNLSLKLVPNETATLRFIAKHTGRFTFELHKAGTELGAFEIYPE